MTAPEREPHLTPDEEREIAHYARPELRVPTAGTVEPRPPIVSALRLWWVPTGMLLVALAFVATDHMLRAGASVAAALWVAAVIRAVATDDWAGGLVVRSRRLDVLILFLAGLLAAVSAFTLDLRDLR
jgi:hypothetical protein